MHFQTYNEVFTVKISRKFELYNKNQNVQEILLQLKLVTEWVTMSSMMALLEHHSFS